MNTPRVRFFAVCAVLAVLTAGWATLPAGAVGGFGDVGSNEFYSDAVEWMAAEDITTGTSPGCFSPDRALTRGELATFLWRYAGEPAAGAHPFTDVPSTAYFADAVGWMYSASVTTGTSPTTFSPDRQITRAEMATLLWRYDGSPQAAQSPFVDVASSSFYAEAVAWMADEQITTGTSPTTFSPNRELTRAEFATFLWRYVGAPSVRNTSGGTCSSATGGGGSGGGGGGTGGGDPGGGGTPPSSPVGTLRFAENFSSDGSMARFSSEVFHRDDSVIAFTSWQADHASTGPGDHCSAPSETRTVTRGQRSTGFNHDWIFRCEPGGDEAKAHVMTSIGDTSGYSIGAFSPNQSFSNVREVRWDVSQTDLGDRQWTEVAIIPADRFDFGNLPCTADVPCATTTHDALGSVGTQWAGQRARKINTPQQPNGYLQATGGLGYRCDSCPYAPSLRFGEGYGAGDPALTSVVIRRQNYFRDNGNGTLTWGFQLDNGTFNEFTAPGSFPDGAVRVVFKDHNYTPLKSPATLLPTTTFTWHWDNIAIYAS